tara:strand:+ start:465 stop:896 length:432 start_codon:yes stop_codon:yes gene_type:complete
VTEGVCIMAAMKEDRGDLDLTKRIEELEKSLSIALEINDKFQRDNKKLADKVRVAEGETSIVKGIGINSPEMRAMKKLTEEKDELIQELRMRIRDMLLISEQHRSILGAEITDRKRLEKEVKDLKVQMSEYLSVRTRGAGSVS